MKTSANDSEHNKESNEPDYNEDEDQLGEEQQEEEEAVEMTSSSTTRNQIFWANLHFILPFKYAQKRLILQT